MFGCEERSFTEAPNTDCSIPKLCNLQPSPLCSSVGCGETSFFLPPSRTIIPPLSHPLASSTTSLPTCTLPRCPVTLHVTSTPHSAASLPTFSSPCSPITLRAVPTRIPLHLPHTPSTPPPGLCPQIQVTRIRMGGTHANTTNPCHKGGTDL